MPMYTPLPKGSVRLLRLLPHPNEDSPIECQLITCSLLDSERTHSYNALSYTWGPEDNKHCIYIDGEQQPARTNLHKALSHFRDCFVERILWIDAICINQGDDIEKGHQVASMAKIYAKASGVIVWLGEAADDSDRAFRAIRRTAEEQDAGFSIPKTYSDRHDIDPEINELDQQAILSLLEREWFQRIWVSIRQPTMYWISNTNLDYLDTSGGLCGSACLDQVWSCGNGWLCLLLRLERVESVLRNAPTLVESDSPHHLFYQRRNIQTSIRRRRN